MMKSGKRIFDFQKMARSAALYFFSTQKFFFLLLLLSIPAGATEIDGYLNTGVWYLKNNIADNPDYTADDDYGNSYVQNDFALFNASLNFNALGLNDPSSGYKINAHLKGRALYKLLDSEYTLAVPDKYRYQLDETNIEYEAKKFNLWVGRHTVYETGGVGVDGATTFFHLKDESGIGVYGGLGNDPRTLTGYIGPSYKTDLFNADFLTGGIFGKIRKEKIQWDLGVNALYFDKKVDRTNFFTQLYWNANKVWSFSAMLDAAFMGKTGLQKALLGITTRASEKFTNRFSVSEFESYFYKASDASGIPVPTGLSPAFIVGTEVDTSRYYRVYDEIQYNFNRNYIYTGLEFAKRTFDDQDRVKYTVGYYDPGIFESPYDVRFQTDIIKNYVGFNTSIDMMVGREFGSGVFRTEAGATFYANERDLFQGNAFVNTQGQVEKESALRLNMEWMTTRKLAWFLNYAFYQETDIDNNNQKVKLHEVYISSNIRF
jgi:hypothetical protein